MLRVYARCGNFNDSAKCVRVSRDRWKCKWYEVGLPSPRSSRVDYSNEELPRYEIAVISDTHWGSIYQQKTVFDNFILDCKERGIQILINLGDSIDGLMFRPNHEQHRFLHSIPEYEEYFLGNYPVFEKNYILSGNHEVSLQKYKQQYNFVKEMTSRRTDLIYVKQGSVIEGPGKAKICLHHGGGSCKSYDESRNKRMKNKVLNLMSEGSCANIYLLGHCHSINIIPSYMNSIIIGTGCFCLPDNFLSNRFNGVDVCGLILSYSVSDDIPVNIETDFRFANQYGGTIKNDY